MAGEKVGKVKEPALHELWIQTRIPGSVQWTTNQAPRARSKLSCYGFHSFGRFKRTEELEYVGKREPARPLRSDPGRGIQGYLRHRRGREGAPGAAPLGERGVARPLREDAAPRRA